MFDLASNVFDWNVFIFHARAFRLVVIALWVVVAILRSAFLVRVVVPHAVTPVPLAVLPLLDTPTFALTAARTPRDPLVIVWVNR